MDQANALEALIDKAMSLVLETIKKSGEFPNGLTDEEKQIIEVGIVAGIRVCVDAHQEGSFNFVLREEPHDDDKGE